MKADLSHQDAHVPESVHAGAPAHDHAHEHAHAHTHHHAAGHDHGTHAHAAKPTAISPTRAPRASLLMSAAPWRLAGAVALSAVLWAAVAWALSGTP